jgi:hypothetical protein
VRRAGYVDLFRHCLFSPSPRLSEPMGNLAEQAKITPQGISRQRRQFLAAASFNADRR